jgi:hypothetical protein
MPAASSQLLSWQKAILEVIAPLYVPHVGFPMDTLDRVKAKCLGDNDLIHIIKKCIEFAAAVIQAQHASSETLPMIEEALNTQ